MSEELATPYKLEALSYSAGDDPDTASLDQNPSGKSVGNPVEVGSENKRTKKKNGRTGCWESPVTTKSPRAGLEVR